MLPNRSVFVEMIEQNHPDEQMLSVTITRGVIQQQELLKDESKKDASRLDRSDYKLVQPGDIAYNKMRAWQGAIGISEFRGIVSPAYVVQRPRKGLNPRFLHYLLRTPMFAKEAERWSYGIASDMWSLRPQHFKMIYACVPSLPEQHAIARYLDHVDRRIQRYIDTKEKLIALLQEARQATIQRAVTRGLDPDVPLKPSGVDWLGDVPANWEVGRLGHLATKFGSGITPRGGATVYQESGVPFLRSQNIHFEGLQMQDVARIAPSLHQELSGTHVKPGDVLLNITGASIGRACAVPEDFVEGNVNQHVCIIRPDKSRLLPRLLAAYLSTPVMQLEIQIEQRGASREGLTLHSIRNFTVLLPPLPEQRAIAAHLDKATAAIDAAVDTARRQADLMREYRASLFAHVVTGKLDVRAAAEHLPPQYPEQKLASN
ncbi:MAG: restriction endonuclease subunit S [Caldilineaceae bacterium]|nr:restriction endonuclease subunit S [Caldilineaceae bacterium]